MSRNGEAFVTKAMLRYICARPTGFEQMYLKTQSSPQKKKKIDFVGRVVRFLVILAYRKT